MSDLPPGIVLPPGIAPTLVDLADCVCTELAETGGGPLCWCGVTPGATVAWDYCGECSAAACGMAWVRLVAVFPYDVFPNQVLDLRCTKPLAYQVELGALRCIPQGVDGEPIAPIASTEVSLLQMADMWALYRAALCCEATDKAFAAYLPLGPEGGCVGGAWTIYLAVD